jgi:uncharacterized protein YukE
MSSPGKSLVEPEALKYYGTERIEDSATIKAISLLMDRVGQMPKAAWGELPWSAKWAEDWARNCAWRREDAQSAHDQMLDTGNRILQSLASYLHTDTRVATTFEKLPQGLDNYLLPADLQDRSLGTYRADGSYRYSDSDPAAPPVPADFIGPVRLPDRPVGNLELSGIFSGHCPAEVDGLSEFMANHSDLLRDVERTLDDYGVSNPHLFSEYLEPANKTAPGVIDLHAEEVLRAANAYERLAGDLQQDNKKLQRSWAGIAGDAAQQHAGILHQYLTRCQAEGKWLGEAGKTCATTLRNIRAGFATAGNDQIGAIMEQYKEFNDWLSGPSAFAAHLAGSDFLGATKDLVESVSGLANMLGTVIAEQAKTANAILKVEVTSNGMPDLGTVAREHQPPARNDAPGSGAWADPQLWGK